MLVFLSGINVQFIHPNLIVRLKLTFGSLMQMFLIMLEQDCC